MLQRSIQGCGCCRSRVRVWISGLIRLSDSKCDVIDFASSCPKDVNGGLLDRTGGQLCMVKFSFKKYFFFMAFETSGLMVHGQQLSTERSNGRYHFKLDS